MQPVQFFPVPGIRLGAVAAGIKKPGRRDLVVVELAPGTHTSGVFTENRFQAAPVRVARERLQGTTPRYLLINTGYANAGTGEAGLQDCLQSCQLLADQASCDAAQVLPFSTGVIGERFPLAPFKGGIAAALKALDGHAWGDAAAGIMTTDTRPKVASRQLLIDERRITVTGMAKGSGMIRPNMATMLGFIATDAAIAAPLLDSWVKRLADASFNCISVDGDTSTNDACLLMATGVAGNSEISSDESPGAGLLYQVLEEIFIELAQAIVRDGEGASKFVEIDVQGAASDADARIVAETIGHSPLVKTALFASDPNWGRILAAVGRAPVSALDVSKVRIWLGDVPIVAAGSVAGEYHEEQGAAVMAQEDIRIGVDLGLAEGAARLWTCDFSYDYVRINAEYRT